VAEGWNACCAQTAGSLASVPTKPGGPTFDGWLILAFAQSGDSTALNSLGFSLLHETSVMM
jgi:hypothetical protein